VEKDVDPAVSALNLAPMEPLRVEQAQSLSDLLRQMADTAFTGRTLGEAADVMEAMIRDTQCNVVMTISGAMTMAGMRHMIVTMIERGWVQLVIATGALVGHGMVEALGMSHYKADPRTSDEEYFTLRLNRVYDTIEPEQNLDQLEFAVRESFRAMAVEREGQPVGTVDILEYLGRALPGEGILQTAVKAGVPVIIPAFTDSELGLDLAVHQRRCRTMGVPYLVYDAFRDLEYYREYCEKLLAEGRQLGIFTVGGGVPRNWAQQIGPYIDVSNLRLGLTVPRIRFAYGVRICPDPVHYGHLSGCTYSEGVTWGKFLPISDGGRYAEVLLDATVGWPLLVRTMLERGL
jgi:deoxyhypusine synthase